MTVCEAEQGMLGISMLRPYNRFYCDTDEALCQAFHQDLQVTVMYSQAQEAMKRSVHFFPS